MSKKTVSNTCPANSGPSFCKCAEGGIFQDVGARVGIYGQYYMSHPLLTSLDAQYACERINGHLLEVDTQEELALIRNAIDPLLMNSIEIHIGGKYHQGSNVISSVASPGNQLVADWHTGQPTAQTPTACITLYRRPRNRGLKMGSIACDEGAHRFICEV